MKKVLVALLGIVVLVFVGGFLFVRSLISPESVRATVETQLAKALGEPVSVGAASVSVWPSAGVTVSDLSIGRPASLTLKRTALNTEMRPLLNRRIENAEIVVEDSDVDLARLMATFDKLQAKTGTSKPDAGTTAPPSGGSGAPAVTLVNIKTIALRNVRLTAGGRKTTITLESSLAGDRLDIANLKAVSDLTTLTAKGAIESLASRKVTLSMTADPLDLDGLIAFGQALGSGGDAAGSAAAPGGKTTSGAGVPDVDLTIDLAASKGRAAGIDFTELKATARLTGNKITLDPFGFGIFGGRLDGSVAVDAKGAEPALTVKGRLAGIDMDRVMAFAGSKGAITGRAGGTLTLSGSGTDPERALARAKGSGSIAITDGKMKGLQLVRAVVLAFGKPDAVQPAEGGEAFSKLGATFSLSSNVLTLTDLSFLSRDVDLKGGGNVRLAGSTIDVTAKAMLSEELTKQAGRDLVRYTAEAGRVTVPATVTGTVDDPKVRIDAGDVMKRAAKNEADRQIKKQSDALLKGLLNRKKQ